MSTILENKVLGYNTRTRRTAFGNGTDTFDTLPNAFGVEPPPMDGYLYARRMGEWVRIVLLPQEEG